MKNIVFLGDSVTDCARKRAKKYVGTPSALGNGWVAYVQKKLSAKDDSVQCWNRGFSSQLTKDITMQEDWWPQADSDDVYSKLTSIMIGINDIWHPLWKSTELNVDKALLDFRALLEKVNPLSDRLMACEPLALPCGEVSQQWWEPLNALTKGQHAICAEMGVPWLGLQESLFQDSQGKHTDYLGDGVHPTDLGHRWISAKWLSFVRDNELL